MAPRSRPRGARRALGWSLRVALFGTLFLLGAWAGLVAAAFPTLDQLERRAEARQVPGAILTADGETVLRRLVAPETRSYLEPAEVPRLLADAAIAAEDRRFRSHGGIDVRGIGRAFVADVRARAVVEGGSTITQQLVKNTYLGPDRTLARKSREAVLAVALESRWSKDRIMAAYLNSAYFGNGRYGAADAARGYFGVPARDLRPAQAALLASLLRAPEGANPDRRPGIARAARNRVLRTMASLGSISRVQLRRALQEPLPRPRAARQHRSQELAPHLADKVVGDLVARYGVARTLGSGLRVRTTIDADVQRAANEAVGQIVPTGLGAALVAIDPASGEVRAVAQGGQARDVAFNVAFDGQRQPGSAFKPFMLAAAFEAGYGPATAVRSAPFEEQYGPVRFTVTNDAGYAGTTTLERATWRSDNTVFARLQHRLGVERALELARSAGIRSRMDPVPALVLGALPQGTTPVELAHAYATFAAHGQRTSMARTGGPRYLSVVSEPGDRQWRPSAFRSRAMPRHVADMVTATLRGVVTRGTGTGAAIGRPAAGKTGTTDEYHDAWFVGYTPDLVAAVWVGHVAGGIPMRTQNGGGPVTGGSLPAAIWREFMSSALAGRPAREFDLEEPEYVTVRIDPVSGLLAGPWCVGSVEARFIAGTEPTETAERCVERDRPVPDLVGLPLDAARALLEHEGFDARPSIREQLATTAEQAGVVLVQRPAAGTPVFRHERIELVVGEHPF